MADYLSDWPLPDKKTPTTMTVNKQFAQDGNALDDRMDQLLEVLAQLLEEPQNQADAGGAEQPVSDLRSGDARVIHVVVNNQKK